jgi:predicted dehydrogenase
MYQLRIIALCIMLLTSAGAFSQDRLQSDAKLQNSALQIAVIGLTHSHVGGVLSRRNTSVEIVGIVESNRDLVKRMATRYGFSEDLVFPSMSALWAKVKPEAVACFNATFEHLEVVRFFAPKGVHIMVEKPLATTVEHAREMESLAKKHGIWLQTNYETTWYNTNHAAYSMVFGEGAIGGIRKVVARDGHTGPVERSRHPEMLPWLTDPILNGGGAIMDFGCYGANLMTWLMGNRRPVSVTAVTQTIKPHNYPKVDDQATVILTYPDAQCVIEASWNWPINWKTLEIYGQTGYVQAVDQSNMRVRLGEEDPEKLMQINEQKAPYRNAFEYLQALVRGNGRVGEEQLSSLANNVIVVEILDAARVSAKENRTVFLQKVN